MCVYHPISTKLKVKIVYVVKLNIDLVKTLNVKYTESVGFESYGEKTDYRV